MLQQESKCPSLIKTRCGVIEYMISGTGPAVLSLHGAMGGYDQADLLARTVGNDRFRFLSPSRPGYLGTALSVGQTPEAQADAYAALLDALSIPDVAVMAISGGGPSAIHFAVRHADRCRGLILISTSAGKTTTRLPLAYYVLKGIGQFPALFRFMQRIKNHDLETNLKRSISDPETLNRVLQDPAVRPLLEELIDVKQGDKRLQGTFNDVNATRTLDFPLESIRVPVLVVHGTQDPFVPFEEHGKVLTQRIPHAELVAVEGGEHVAIFTHRNWVRDQVVRFLTKVSSE